MANVPPPSRSRSGLELAAADLALTPTSDPEWRLVEEGFTLLREHEIESLFAIANGFLGTRASLMDGSPLSSPATFVAGVFDGPPGQPPQLLSLPDWTRITISVDGQPLRLDLGSALDHRRILDMRQGVAWREWRQRDANGRVTRIVGLRLASATDRRLLIQSVVLSPENYSGPLTFEPALDGEWVARTSRAEVVAAATATRWSDPDRGVRTWTTPESGPRSAHVELGRKYRLDRLVIVHTSRDGDDPERLARDHLGRALAEEIAVAVSDHVAAWSRRWEDCDLEVRGDAPAQEALRFAAYHLLSAANPDDPSVSIGARTLSGPAYLGHVFWDTEIFMLPFFTLTFPEAARALLTYRYRTLPAARARAAGFGWSGALYAWESAGTGEDVTPRFALLPGGEVVPIETGTREQHISADVAYGVWSYWRASGDDAFLLESGAEILLETARFWASRAQLQADGKRHICGVIGPDEYHELVDDNAYTNGMAGWNLRTAGRVANLMAERWPTEWRALAARLELTPDEPTRWSAVAGELYTGLDEGTGLIEQFRGYFALEDIRPSAFEPSNAPIDVLLGRERLERSQIIKQADVLMLLYLLWDEYPPEVRAANFRYYEPRCAHGSSLSPSIHALFAARLDDLDLALRYFRQAMDIDLSNTLGNAAGGVHAAALGGLWQAAVFGFAGVRLTEQGPEAHPNLPPAWERVAFRLKHQGRSHQFDLAQAARPGQVKQGGALP